MTESEVEDGWNEDALIIITRSYAIGNAEPYSTA